jgi:hypothetical protein
MRAVGCKSKFFVLVRRGHDAFPMSGNVWNGNTRAEAQMTQRGKEKNSFLCALRGSARKPSSRSVNPVSASFWTSSLRCLRLLLFDPQQVAFLGVAVTKKIEYYDMNSRQTVLGSKCVALARLFFEMDNRC